MPNKKVLLIHPFTKIPIFKVFNHSFDISQGLLERLAEGPVIGDGGFVFEMEKRGYVKAGPWTPEVLMENPEAGTCLCSFIAFLSHSFESTLWPKSSKSKIQF